MTHSEMSATRNGDPVGIMRIPVSTGYLIKISIGCAVGLAGCLWIVLQGAIPSWTIAISINILGLGCIFAPVAVAMLELTLTPEGMRLRSPFGTKFARWVDADVSLTDAFAYVVVTATHCHQRNWWQPGRQSGADGCVFRIRGAWFGMTSEGLRDLIGGYRTKALNHSAGDISEHERLAASPGS